MSHTLKVLAGIGISTILTLPGGAAARRDW